jgi:tRNA (guanine10-N2)-dimethyltransferase
VTQKNLQEPYTPKHTLYYSILSGEHPTLPSGELVALLESWGGDINLIYRLETIALIDTNTTPETIGKIVKESGFIREAGYSLILAPEEPEAFRIYLEDHKLPRNEYWIVYEKHLKPEWNPDTKEIIKTIISANRESKFTKTGHLLKVDHYPGFIHIGIRLAKKNYSEFMKRLPRRRPVFRPGTLDPILSRVIVNLSRPSKKITYLDPFCGVGGFAIEAGLMGYDPIICGDIDYHMMKGAVANIYHYLKNRVQAIFYYGDAGRLPFRSNSIDRIATDPPYGRTTSTRGISRITVITEFLKETIRILVPGGYLVFASPIEIKPRKLAEDSGFVVVDYFEMYVHRGLVRGVVVARKPL